MSVNLKDDTLHIKPSAKVSNKSAQYMIYGGIAIILIASFVEELSFLFFIGLILAIFGWSTSSQLKKFDKQTKAQAIKLDPIGYHVESTNTTIPSSKFKKFFIDDFDKNNPQYIITLKSDEEIDNLILIQSKDYSAESDKRNKMVEKIHEYVQTHYGLKEATKDEIIEISQYRLGGGVQSPITGTTTGVKSPGQAATNPDYYTTPQRVTDEWALENSRKEAEIFMKRREERSQ